MADLVPAGGDEVEGREVFEFDLFLSFASADRAAVESLMGTLGKGRLKVFWAPDTLREAVGLSFFEAIGHYLVKCRHFVLYWTAEAKASGWVASEYEAFFNQCHVKNRDTRRLVILTDGREPFSSLPVFLRNLQLATSIDDVVTWLGGVGPAQRQLDRARREAALLQFIESHGRVVHPTLRDQIVALLPAEGWDGSEVEPLLSELTEVLDAGERLRRSLKDFLLELAEEKSVAVVPPVAPPARPSGRPAPSILRTGVPADLKAGAASKGPLGMRMRFVPAGTYTIGSPEDEPGRFANETRHEVELTRGFWLGETPVTQAQWQRLVPGPQQPSFFKAGGADLPVESISWFEAAEFANRLSDLEELPRCYELVNPRGILGGGKEGGFTCDGAVFVGLDSPGYRLPTEAEWEVTARAGAPTAIYTGGLTLRGERHGPELFQIAWYGGNSGVSYEGSVDSSDWKEMQFASVRSGTHPVGKKVANGWGFHDLLGNVFEWTGDWYGDYPKGRAVDPLGPPEGSYRVIRGGSWFSFAHYVRAACRNRSDPSSRWSRLGFRFARGQSALQPGGRSPRPGGGL